MKKKNKWSKCSAVILMAILAGNLGAPAVAVAAQAERSLTEAAPTPKNNPLDALKKAFEDDEKQSANKLKDSDQNKAREYIIQLDAKPAAQLAPAPDGTTQTNREIAAADEKVEEGQNDERKAIETIADAKVEKSFTYLINGLKISATPLEIEEIKAKVAGVGTVSEVQDYTPEDVDANALAQIDQVWKSDKHATKGEGMVVSVLDTGTDPDHQDLILGESGKAHKKLDANRINQVVKSGILNGAGEYFTDKVPYGFNYADDNTEIKDQGLGHYHGHHVTGIVAANGTAANNGKPIDGKTHVDGVAPEAQLLMMKVGADKTGAISSDAIIAAIEDSVKLGADVINMSIGDASNTYNPDNAEINAVEQASKKGVLTVAAAGNSGNYSSLTQGGITDKAGFDDQRTVGRPAVAPSALAVAASNNAKLKVNKVALLNKDVPASLADLSVYPTDSFQRFVNNPNGIHDIDVVPVPNQTDSQNAGLPGRGLEADYAGLNVKNKWVVILRGDITFNEKIDRAFAKGAEGVIIIDNVDAPTPNTMTVTALSPAFSTTLSDGKALLKYIGTGKTITLDKKLTSGTVADPTAAQPTSFTSWGTGKDFSFKPEIMATGGNVWSTMNDNGYGSMSGTSMATPFVAGSEALVLSQLKKQPNAPIGNKLTNAAKLAVENAAVPAFDKANGTYYSPRRQGTGNIQVEDALNNTTVLANKADGNGGVTLKQISSNQAKFTVTLTNYSDKTANYQLDDKYLTVAESKTLANGDLADVAIPKTALTPSKKAFKVAAGATVEVTFTANLKNATKQRWVEGYVGFINAATHKAISIPYFGFYGDFNQQQVVDPLVGLPGSKMNLGHIQDIQGNLIGSTIGLDSNDHQYIKSNKLDDMWFSPSGGENLADILGTKKFYLPYLPLTRDAEDVSVKIYNSAHQVVKNLYVSEPLAHAELDIASPENGIQTSLELGWNGTDNTGKNVPDGDYTYEVSTTPSFTGAKAQTATLKARIDRVAPQITNLKLQFNKADQQYHISLDAKEETSGLSADKPLLFGINTAGGRPIKRTVGELNNGQALRGQQHFDFAITTSELAAARLYKDYNFVYSFTGDYAGNTVGTVMKTDANGNVTPQSAADVRSIERPYKLTKDDYVVKIFKAYHGNACFGHPIPDSSYVDAKDRLTTNPNLRPTEDLIIHKDEATRKTQLMMYDRVKKVIYQNSAVMGADGYYSVIGQNKKEDDWSIHHLKATSLLGYKPMGLHSLHGFNPDKWEDTVDHDNTYKLEYEGKSYNVALKAENQSLEGWIQLNDLNFTLAGSENPFDDFKIMQPNPNDENQRHWVKINGIWATIQFCGMGHYELFAMSYLDSSYWD
ncbi:MAG: S8 family serine peptidase [Lactobacillaceae bacterium]|jgi:lactocepin|nr:S8 family serine peptidase [Lactobacillaceae bacterium]